MSISCVRVQTHLAHSEHRSRLWIHIQGHRLESFQQTIQRNFFHPKRCTTFSVDAHYVLGKLCSKDFEETDRWSEGYTNSIVPNANLFLFQIHENRHKCCSLTREYIITVWWFVVFHRFYSTPWSERLGWYTASMARWGKVYHQCNEYVANGVVTSQISAVKLRACVFVYAHSWKSIHTQIHTISLQGF